MGLPQSTGLTLPNPSLVRLGLPHPQEARNRISHIAPVHIVERFRKVLRPLSGCQRTR